MSQSTQEEIRRRNDPSVRTRLRKSERTRQAILEAVFEFLGSRPFRDLTVAELMSLAGSSRPVFYQYFADLHELIENLLNDLQQEILAVARPWLTAEDDPVLQLAKSLSGLVKVCYRRGPIVRAVVEAAPMDERLERAWNDFMKVFDDAVTERIEHHQAARLIPSFEVRPVAIALNRMDVGTVIYHFGSRPRTKPDRVYQSIARIWISTIYGHEALAKTKEIVTT
jgi:AcrR family transcriptional regulator